MILQYSSTKQKRSYEQWDKISVMDIDLDEITSKHRAEITIENAKTLHPDVTEFIRKEADVQYGVYINFDAVISMVRLHKVKLVECSAVGKESMLYVLPTDKGYSDSERIEAYILNDFGKTLMRL